MKWAEPAFGQLERGRAGIKPDPTSLDLLDEASLGG
jgi:hypothetical protein